MKTILLAILVLSLTACSTEPLPEYPAAPTSVTELSTPLADSNLKIISINVSQGDATLLIATDETHMKVNINGTIENRTIKVPYTILIDCGPTSMSEKVASTLKNNDIQDITLLYITNKDRDHIGACKKLFEQFNIQSVYTNDIPEDTDVSLALKQLIDEKRTTLLKDEYGEYFEGGFYPLNFYGVMNLSFFVAYDTNPSLTSENDHSLIFYLQRGAFSALFPGDCEKGCESELVRTQNLTPVTLLKAGHHGSHTSSTPTFLDALLPKHVLISSAGGCPYAGCTAAIPGNRYGHPRSIVISNAEQRGANILRTDLSGDITFTVDLQGNYQIDEER